MTKWIARTREWGCTGTHSSRSIPTLLAPPLVQPVTRCSTEMSTTRTSALETALRLVAAALPDEPDAPAWDDLLPHADAVTGHAARRGMNPYLTVTVLNRLAAVELDTCPGNSLVAGVMVPGGRACVRYDGLRPFSSKGGGHRCCER